MRQLTRLLPLVLAACAAAPDAGFRATDRAIYSNAVFQPDRLAGHWHQIADFAPPGAAPCGAGGIAFSPQAGGKIGVQADLCLAGLRRSFTGEARVSGPGRLRLTGADPAGIGAEWWVLWADDGYRTLVIGTPQGGFGMILNREATLPADRWAAARDILAWNGYDLARLRDTGPP